jgi:dihydroneopterin triphosphate diphosphatase
MGHVREGERAVACAVRELGEEVGLRARDAIGMWALEQVHPYFVPAWDAVVMSPRFAVEVAPEWTPVLNEEHVQYRWVADRDVDRAFLWPGQRACVGEIVEMLGMPELAEALRVRGPNSER